MGPTMFPRIHVNDTTEKGGARRAPPRNKMALYEQLTIPSIRFTHAAAPASLVHPPTQGATYEKDMFFSYNLHTRSQSEKQYTRYHESNTPPTQVEKKKNVEDDHFTDRPCGSQNTRNSDSLSENSVVDSIYGHDITPDDVIGFIGHKHFWKARRQIINQQRIFAAQVFELHRLIKVQRLIAASPHVLLEDSTYFTKPIKASSAKRKPLNHPVKEISYVPKQKGEHEKPFHKNKSSSKNPTEKVPFTSVQARAVSGDYNSGPWGFNPPPLGNQWLIPVMSPSEGLVYKPYSGPGLVVGPDYGGCGPSGPNPLTGNFPIPAYGFPSLHGYLPVYGMPITNGLPFLDQISAHYRNLYAIPGRENRASPDVLNTSEDIEAQASIASSSVERLHDYGESKSTEERNVLQLFPTSPPSDGPGLGPKPLEPDNLTRVIKVVPHNARSAGESAARIFKSIQEGRKQCDWV